MGRAGLLHQDGTAAGPPSGLDVDVRVADQPRAPEGRVIEAERGGGLVDEARERLAAVAGAAEIRVDALGVVEAVAHVVHAHARVGEQADDGVVHAHEVGEVVVPLAAAGWFDTTASGTPRARSSRIASTAPAVSATSSGR